MTPNTTLLPTYFISHGGGPWPYVPAMRQAHAVLEAALQDMPRQLGRKPAAVLMVSAHWEEPDFTVMAQAQPGMLYDYGGFPANTYTVRYDAPGAPALAQRVQALAQAAGLGCGLETERGFDHGAFVPMSVIYPQADVPLVQLSLRRGLAPEAHLALGRALAPLRAQDVLIIGSGLSFHNLGVRGPAVFTASKAFDDWLGETLIDSTPAERAKRLAHWAEAPGARQAHPREEHLLPLMVAAGAAHGDRASRCYQESGFLGGAAVSSFRFDAA